MYHVQSLPSWRSVFVPTGLVLVPLFAGILGALGVQVPVGGAAIIGNVGQGVWDSSSSCAGLSAALWASTWRRGLYI